MYYVVMYVVVTIVVTNAEGRELMPLGTTTMKVNLDNLETGQCFTVIKSLSVL